MAYCLSAESGRNIVEESEIFLPHVYFYIHYLSQEKSILCYNLNLSDNLVRVLVMLYCL